MNNGHFQRGRNARTSIDCSGRRDDHGDRARDSSTLRLQLSCLPSEVGMGRQQLDLLQVYILGAVQDGRFGSVSHVSGQPVLVASTARSRGALCRPQGRTYEVMVIIDPHSAGGITCIRATLERRRWD